VKARAEDFGRLPRFAAADSARLAGVMFGAAAIAAGKVQIVSLIAGLRKQAERAGHAKLDIIRVGTDGNGNWTRH
jgi:hypothetical protein